MAEISGHAAREEVVAEAVAGHQPGAGLADRFEMLQSGGEIGGEIRGRRLLAFRRLRQQQARFEIGEPGRHHQIIGGDLDLELARLLDEGEILVGERQDRNAREIDLLVAGERQQEIERAFEAVDVDHERRLVERALGRG